MCGISGFRDNEYFRDDILISKFQIGLNHRGPDFTNYYQHKPLTLISNRLSILDLSKQGNQPMMSSSGRFVIVYNGEIYNYRELNKKYLINHNFISKSDTETLLELIENFGLKKTCHLLDGMYAFALLDKIKNKLYLVRDKNGQKPLYYYKTDKSFVFSSEIKLFRQYPKFNKTISKIGEQLFLRFGYINVPYTIYEYVFKLDPTKYLELDINSNNYTLNKLFEKENKKLITNININNALSKFEDKLEKSVKKHLISDRPLGCFLSGGIDSSLVTFFAKKYTSNNLHTFSIGFNDKDYDESYSATQIAKHLGTNHHILELNNNKFFDLVKNISEYLDEPFADSSLIPTILLCKESKNFVDVVLTGDGSDEFFLGYNRYKFLNSIFNFIFKINISIRKSIKFLVLNINPNFIKFFFKLLPFKLTTRDYENFSKFIELLDSKNKQDIFYKIISDNDFFLFNKKINFFQNDLDSINEISRFDQNVYLVENGMTKIDRASMHFSLETRSPFLSNDLTEFANNLSPEIHTDNFRELKAIPKLLFKKLLGKNLIQKYKTGFSVPPDLFFDNKIKKIIISKCHNYQIANKHKINERLFKKYIKLYIKNKVFNVNLWKIYIYQSWLEYAEK